MRKFIHRNVCQNYVEAGQDGHDQLVARITEIIPNWSIAPVVDALRALGGLDRITVVIFLPAISDVGRFTGPASSWSLFAT
jgi:transposase